MSQQITSLNDNGQVAEGQFLASVARQKLVTAQKHICPVSVGEFDPCDNFEFKFRCSGQIIEILEERDEIRHDFMCPIQKDILQHKSFSVTPPLPTIT